MEGRILTVLTDIIEVVVGESWAIAWCWRTGTVLPVLTVLTNRDSSDRHVLGNRGESWLGRKSCSCLAKKHFDANYCGEPWWGEVGTSCKVKYCHRKQLVWDTKNSDAILTGHKLYFCFLLQASVYSSLFTVFFHPCVQSGLSTFQLCVSAFRAASCWLLVPLPPFPTTIFFPACSLTIFHFLPFQRQLTLLTLWEWSKCEQATGIGTKTQRGGESHV